MSTTTRTPMLRERPAWKALTRHYEQIRTRHLRDLFAADETRGGWYLRQLLGAANIDGGPLFHVISGNLGYQVEHHLFPDMPSTRYGEIAPKVREICERYELPYNSGPFHQQLGMVQRTILRLALPGGKTRPKPGPYHGPRVRGSGEQAGAASAA